jgi:hypothetical protein
MRASVSRAALVLVALGLAVPAPVLAGRRGLQGDGKVTTERRDVPGAFDGISLRGAIDARVKVGPAASIAVTIDANLQPHVKTRLEGSTLVVEQDEELRPTDDARVEVTLPALRAFSTSGSGDATLDATNATDRGDLALATSGSGDVRWKGEAGALTVATQGSGDVTLEGRARSLTAATAGSGDVKASGLTVRDADARTSGSGDVSITVDGGTLRAHTSGSGDVTYSGTASVEARASGSGEVIGR